MDSPGQQDQQMGNFLQDSDSNSMNLNDVFGLNNFKWNDSPQQQQQPSASAADQMLMLSDNYQMSNQMKAFQIKEEPVEMPSSTCSQLSPLSAANSSGLGSSLHSQSPHNPSNINSYFSNLTMNQQPNNTPNTSDSGLIFMGSSANDSMINIKNEAFSPQSMDICN